MGKDKRRKRSRSAHTRSPSRSRSDDSRGKRRRSSGSRDRRRRRSRDRSRSRSASPAAELDRARAKLLKYAARGDVRKARRLLRHHPGAAARGSSDGGGGGGSSGQQREAVAGSTPLHEAARRGYGDVVALLVRHGADAGAPDSLGNTPAHLAVRAGHMDLLVTLLTAARPPDIDRPNAAGLTVRQLSQAAMEAEAAAESAQQRRRQQRQDEEDYAYHGSSSGGGGSEGAQGDQEWRDRLRDEMSDDEAGGIGWARYRQPDDSFVWPDGLKEDDDESWADRLWRDMLRHQKAQRDAERKLHGFGDGAAARAAAAEETRRRAEAARAASDRILKEERERSANWREGMMRQVAEEYEAGWARLETLTARTASSAARPPIKFSDIPWPSRALLALARGGGVAVAAVAAAAEGAAAKDELRDLIMFGVNGAADLKRRLRSELLRWHPDKMTARLGGRLGGGDGDAVAAGVRAVAQQLTALMASG